MRKLPTGLWVVLIGLGVVSTPGLIFFFNAGSIQKDPVDQQKEKDQNKSKTKVIKATCDFDPDKLNLKSKGKWITVYIELENGYSVHNIVLDEILLNDFLSPEIKPFDIGDWDNNNIPDLMIKFDRSAVISNLEPIQFPEMVITGKLSGGMEFKATCVIEILNF